MEILQKYHVVIITINPCKVASNTLLMKIHELGLYKTPHYYSIVHALKDNSINLSKCRIIIELPGGGCVGDISLPHLCEECLPTITAFNNGQYTNEPKCWDKQILKTQPSYIEESKNYLDSITSK